MVVEIVGYLAPFLCAFPVYGEVDEFILQAFQLPPFLLVYGKLTKSVGKLCPVSSLKDVFPKVVCEGVYYVLPFIERQVDGRVLPTKVSIVFLAGRPPIHFSSRHNYIPAGAFAA